MSRTISTLRWWSWCDRSPSDHRAPAIGELGYVQHQGFHRSTPARDLLRPDVRNFLGRFPAGGRPWRFWEQQLGKGRWVPPRSYRDARGPQRGRAPVDRPLGWTRRRPRGLVPAAPLAGGRRLVRGCASAGAAAGGG